MNKDTVITYAAGGDSITFAYNTPLWLTSVTGISANTVAISETQGVGQVGSTFGSQSVQPRDITINGLLRGDVEANRRSILACVLPGVVGRLTVTQGSESWYIEGAPKKTPDFSDGAVVQDFQFSLRCPYPYWKSTEQQAEQIAGLMSCFSLPFHFQDTWYISEYSSNLFATVVNVGSMATVFDVIFTATAQVTDPEFYHVERGSSIKLHRTMAAGEQITVSTVYGRKGVTITLPDGGQINGFKYLDVDSDLNLQMDPGDNTIRCDAAGNREGLQVQVILPKGVIPGL